MERVQNTNTNYIITTITSGVPEIVQLLLLHSPATPKMYRGIVSFSLRQIVFFSADGRRRSSHVRLRRLVTSSLNGSPILARIDVGIVQTSHSDYSDNNS